MVRPLRYAVRAGLPERSNRTWTEALRADIKHIHDLRWELVDRIPARNSAHLPPDREPGPEIRGIYNDAHRCLQEFEKDIYHCLDPYLNKLEQGLVERGLLEAAQTTKTDGAEHVLVTEWNELKRLRAAKMRAIDLTRQVLRQLQEGNRADAGIWTRIPDAVMRWVFLAGLWLWVHVLRRDTRR